MNAPLAKEQLALLMSDSLTYRVNPVQGTETAPPAARPSMLASLGRRISGGFAALLTFPRRRAVIDELSRLTDRELTDIGLSRAELKQVFDPHFSAGRRNYY